MATGKWAGGGDEDEAVEELRKVCPQAFIILCQSAGYRAVYSRFCEITVADYPDGLDGDHEPEKGTTTDF